MIYYGSNPKPTNPTNYHFSALPQSNKTVPPQASIKEKFPPVYTQTCGCCTSCAVLACDAYYYHDNKKWIPSFTFTYYNQLILNDDRPLTDTGSNVEDALNVTRKKGVCNSKVWANTEPFDKKPSKEAYADGLKGKEITKYYRIKNLYQLKQAISSNLPVAGSFAWCFTDYDDNYVMNTPTPDEARDCHNGHAIVLVGYDDKTQLFEFRNSWGKSWGNKGYAFITYETINRVLWFNDTYAITK